MAVQFQTKIVADAVKRGELTERSGLGAEIMAKEAIKARETFQSVPFAGNMTGPDGRNIDKSDGVALFRFINAGNPAVQGLSQAEVAFVRKVYNELLSNASSGFAGLAAFAAQPGG
jgi:hypothetical protein